MTPCNTCYHAHTVNMPEGIQAMRCFRVRTMKDKRGPESGIIHPGVYGSSIIAERDHLPEPHRISGDKCGPSGIHWEAKGR